MTTLIEAVRSRDAVTVERLLEGGAPAESLDEKNQSALSLAAAFAAGLSPDAIGEAEPSVLAIIDALLAKGARADFGGPDQDPPLFCAIQNGTGAIVSRLLQAGAAYEDYWANQLVARTWGRVAILRALLDGCSTMSRSAMLRATASTLSTGSEPATMVDLLLERGAGVEPDPDSGETALLYAVLCGSTEVARRLVERGARSDVPLREEMFWDGDFLPKKTTAVSILRQRFANPDAHGGREAVLALAEAAGVAEAALSEDPKATAKARKAVSGSWSARTYRYEQSPDGDPDYEPEDVEIDREQLTVELRPDGTVAWSGPWKTTEGEGTYRVEGKAVIVVVGSWSFELTHEKKGQMTFTDHDEEHGSDVVWTLGRD